MSEEGIINQESISIVFNPGFYIFDLKELTFQDLPKDAELTSTLCKSISEIKSHLQEVNDITIGEAKGKKIKITYQHKEKVHDFYSELDGTPINGILYKPNFDGYLFNNKVYFNGSKKLAQNTIKSLRQTYLNALENLSLIERKEKEKNILQPQKIKLVNFIEYLRNEYGDDNIVIGGAYIKDIDLLP